MLPFISRLRRKWPQDLNSVTHRRCRFCGRGKPVVRFRKLAHAVSDFLGNQSIISMNECDECNTFFGEGCEDHLSKVTMLLRTHADIPRKDSVESTFKDRIHDENLRIDSSPGALNIRIPEPNSVDDLLVDGELPETISLGGDLRSQPYIPIEAVKALVKFACSICPKGELGQIQCAVDWVRGRRDAGPLNFIGWFGGVRPECSPPAVNLRRQAHVLQHLGEPWVRAQVVQGGIDLEPDDLGIPLVAGLFQPLERLIFLAQGRVDAGNWKSETEPALRKPC